MRIIKCHIPQLYLCKMTKTKKSRADTQRAYRERQKEKNHEAALEKERQRW